MLDKLLLTEQTMSAMFLALAKPQPGPEELLAIRARPEIYLNDLLAEGPADGDPLKHPLRKYIFDGRDSVQPWQAFRSMIYLYFTGLCYYMGAQTRSLPVEKPEIEVYFGGRGASLLSWFAASRDETRRMLEYAFRLGLNRPKDDNVSNVFPEIPHVGLRFEGLAIDRNPELPRLKTEVAKGLLLEPDLSLKDGVLDGVPVGETGWMKRDGENLRSVSWNTRIFPDDLASLKTPAASAFESNMIGHFRYVVLEEDKEKFLTTFNLDHARLRALRVDGGAVEDLIQRSSEGANKVAQPIFAYELKALMSQYARMVNGHGAD